MKSLLDILNTQYDEDDEEGNEMPNVFSPSPYYSNDDAIDLLSGKKDVFTLLSLNCQSLFAKFDQLQVYLNHFQDSLCQFSVIGLQETWLSSEHDISFLQIEGYNFIHKPKSASQHGGVAFYIKNNIEYQVLPVTVDDSICDSLFLELKLNSNDANNCSKVILGNIYRPPRELAENYEVFNAKLEEAISTIQYANQVLLIGDFNIDLLKVNDKPHVNDFFDMLLSGGFIPKITLPTRVTDQSKTLIDNCFVKLQNSSNINDISAGILRQQISDHYPYFICFDWLQTCKPKQKLVRVSKFTKSDRENFKREVASTCTIEKFCSSDPNINYEVLQNVLVKAAEKHLPQKLVKYKKHKHKKARWITQGIIRSIKFRDKMFARLRKTSPDDELFHTLKINLQTYNRILKKSIRTAKKSYYQEQFSKYQKDIKNTWKTIKNIMGSSEEKETSKEFVIDNIPCSDPQIIADEFNRFFTDVGPTLASNIIQPNNLSYSNFLKYNITSNFDFQTVSDKCVLETIDNLKCKTSYGVDKISNNLLKEIKNIIAKPLTKIINQCIDTGMFPEQMKIARVLPIHKKMKITFLVTTDQYPFCLVCQRSLRESFITSFTNTLLIRSSSMEISMASENIIRLNWLLLIW